MTGTRPARHNRFRAWSTARSSPSLVTSALAGRPRLPGSGGFKNSNRPSSEDAYRINAPKPGLILLIGLMLRVSLCWNLLVGSQINAVFAPKETRVL